MVIILETGKVQPEPGDEQTPVGLLPLGREERGAWGPQTMVD